MNLLGVCVLLAAVSSAVTKNTDVYSKLGGEATLRPAPVPGRIASVLWKHEEDQVAEWIDGKVELEYNGILVGHGEVTLKDGALRISNMTEKHRGLYTVEINSDLQPDGFLVTLLKDVPKPEVVVRPLTCSHSSDDCTLTCHGDTGGAEPVTYQWKRGEGEWTVGSAEIPIKNLKGVPRPETYTCRMKNHVSSMDSEPFRDPFLLIVQAVNPGLIAGLSVFAILLAVGGGVGGLVYHFRNRDPINGLLVRCGIMNNQVGTCAETSELMQGVQNGVPRSEGPKDGAPGSEGPQDGAPGSEGPQDGAPGAPGSEGPQDRAPGSEGPQDGAPGSEGPQDGTPPSGDPGTAP